MSHVPDKPGLTPTQRDCHVYRMGTARSQCSDNTDTRTGNNTAHLVMDYPRIRMLGLTLIWGLSQGKSPSDGELSRIQNHVPYLCVFMVFLLTHTFNI